MSFSWELTIAFGSTALLTLLATQWLGLSRVRPRYPPGPPGLPIIGNIHQLPTEYQERTFFDWGQKYGDIVYARLFRKPVIVVNSVQVARDLMEKRSANYSDRPELVLLNDLMGWDSVVTHFHYGARFRKHRRWIQDGFQSKQAIVNYRSVQQREACTLLMGLLDSPEEFLSHIKRFAAGVITEITYGHRVHTLRDDFVALADRASTETVRAGSPGSSILSLLVDFFPFLKHYPLWLPGSGFKVKTNEIRTLVRNMLDKPYDMVKDRIAAGNNVPCFTANLLDDHLNRNSLSADDEADIKGAAGVLYAAGSDTSVAVLASFLLAVTQNPEVLMKAHEEMDRVVGLDRLPDFDDRQSLPYLDCLIKEVLRWTAPAPLAIPHCAVNTDVYREYEIPAGAWIIPNVWGMLHDPQTYPDPMRFWPERFLGLDKEQADAVDPRNIAFGFGRRLCPGQNFADANVYLVVAYIVATMDIARTSDQNGKEIIPPGEFHSGFVLHPKPFSCSIKPRSHKAVNLIRQMSIMCS